MDFYSASLEEETLSDLYSADALCCLCKSTFSRIHQIIYCNSDHTTDSLFLYTSIEVAENTAIGSTDPQGRKN